MPRATHYEPPVCKTCERPATWNDVYVRAIMYEGEFTEEDGWLCGPCFLKHLNFHTAADR